MASTIKEHMQRSRSEVADLLAQLSEGVGRGQVEMLGFKLEIPPTTGITFELHTDAPDQRIRIEIGLAGPGRAVHPGAPALAAELSRPGG